MDIQYIIPSKTERLRRGFRDKNDTLVNVTNPKINIKKPDGTTAVANGVPIAESTGIYYYDFYLSTVSPEGIYQAYWEGTYNTEQITMDKPQFLYARNMNYAYGEEIAGKIRRIIGDLDPNNYRVQQSDLFYYIKDGVEDAEADYLQGYTATVSQSGVTFNKDLTVVARALFTWKTVYLILNGMLFSGLWDVGNFRFGDIDINLTSGANTRNDFIKGLGEKIKYMVDELKLNGSGGELVEIYTNLEIQFSTTDYPYQLAY